MAEGLSTLEAEELVKKLQPWEVRDVGTQTWIAQHSAIERLNMQAHFSAQRNSDEFVVEELQTYEKIGVLIENLLCIDVWKERVLPLLNLTDDQLAGVKPYMMLYNEGLIVNLLEVAFYHRDACVSAGGILVELAEYIIRKLIILATRPANEWYLPKRSAQEALSLSQTQRHREQALTIDLNVCFACLSLARLLVDHSRYIPPGVLDVFLASNDLIALLVQLMETKPWIRRDGSEVLKFEDGQWLPVPPRDRLMLTKVEAQVWLALHVLILDIECQRKYRFDEAKKNTIGRLRRFFNDTLFDQLPVLSDLQRGIELICVSAAPPADSSTSAVRIEEVRRTLLPEVRNRLIRGQNWASIAAWQHEHVFQQTAEERLADMRQMAENYSLPIFEEACPKPRCACCGRPAKNRCSKCHSEWYCDRECQIRRWPEHKKACTQISATVAASAKTSA